MEATQYRVVLTGEVLPEHDAEVVHQRMAELGSAGIGEIRKLFREAPVVLMRGLSEERAEALRASIESAGAVIRIEEDVAGSVAQPSPLPAAPEELAQSHTAGERRFCGVRQKNERRGFVSTLFALLRSPRWLVASSDSRLLGGWNVRHPISQAVLTAYFLVAAVAVLQLLTFVIDRRRNTTFSDWMASVTGVSSASGFLCAVFLMTAILALLGVWKGTGARTLTANTVFVMVVGLFVLACVLYYERYFGLVAARPRSSHPGLGWSCVGIAFMTTAAAALSAHCVRSERTSLPDPFLQLWRAAPAVIRSRGFVPVALLLSSSVYGSCQFLQALGSMVSLAKDRSPWVEVTSGFAAVWLAYSVAAAWATYLLLRARPRANRVAAVIVVLGAGVFLVDLVFTFLQARDSLQDMLRAVVMTWPPVLVYVVGAAISIPLLLRGFLPRLLAEESTGAERPFGVLEAMVVYIGYVVVLFALPSYLITLWAAISAESGGDRAIQSLRGVLMVLEPELRMMSVVVGGFVVAMLIAIYAKGQLKNRSIGGIAWVRGSFDQLVVCSFVGIFVGVCADVLNSMSGAEQAVEKAMEAVETSQQTGFGSLFLNVLSILVLGPVIEETLFRGVVLGGVSRSWGVTAGVIASSLLFVPLHPYVVVSWSVAASLLAVSLAAAWARIQWQAIGPAIAVHVAYNVIVSVG